MRFKSVLGVGAVLALAIGAQHDVASAQSVSKTTAISTQQVRNSARAAHVSGVLVAAVTSTGMGHKPPPEPAFNGTPPLFFRGIAGCVSPPCLDGNVMMTASTGPLVVVPIFWNPAGYPMTSSYKNLITSYLADVAKMSGQTQNVYSVADEYSGNNGSIHYNVKLGPVFNDTDALPGDGCTVAASDTTEIYADGSGYSACLDDGQLQAEVEAVIAANGLPHDLTHIYVLYLPKGVESCFFPGDTVAPGANVCSINHQPSAAYCAYHNNTNTGGVPSTVYANLVYPIYQSPTHFTCGSDARVSGFPVLESPNGDPDADTEISPTSHEIIEAITDPDGETGWGDSSGNEIGDDCAYIYGRTRGAPGAYFNQVINGGHFLTQEEFSNNVFAASGGKAGCVQGASDE